jgi:hypothetical protein
MSEYAGGKFDSRMPPLPGERKAISDAAEKVRAELEANAEAAQFNALVKAALDHVSLPVRIANDDGQILYVNNALKETLRKYEAGFRKQIPGFDPEKMVGGSVGMFYADSVGAIARLHSLTRPAALRKVLGGRDFDVVTSPVFGDRGERLGSAGQWTDMTDQLAAEKEVASIVEAAAAGDFKKRIAETDKSGFMLQMAQGLNTILGSSEEALGEMRWRKATSARKSGPTSRACSRNSRTTRTRPLRNCATSSPRSARRRSPSTHGRARNRDRQQRPVAAHRGAGLEPRGNRKQHGGVRVHREDERGERARGQQTCGRGVGERAARW